MTDKISTPSVSINIGSFTNITYPFTDITKLDREQILEDVKFFTDILNDIGKIVSVSVKNAPNGVEVVTKCKSCGGSNLTYSTGKSQSTGNIWHAFDCQDCTTERNGNTYPTRNFSRLIPTVNAANVDAAVDTGIDDSEVPF